MALSRIRLPSFSLVLTSGGWDSYPTAVKFDPCASYTMLPIVVNRLMRTIDLGGSKSVDDALNQYTKLDHETIILKEQVTRSKTKKIARVTKKYILVVIRSLKKRLSEISSKPKMF